MLPVRVVVAYVFVHEPLQMAFVQHNHLVEYVTAAIANETLGHTVLPRASNRGANRDNAQALHGLQYLTLESVLAIQD